MTSSSSSLHQFTMLWHWNPVFLSGFGIACSHLLMKHFFVIMCKTIPTQHAYNFWWDNPEIACKSFLLIYSEGITLHHNIYSVAYPTGRKLSFELNFAMLKYMQSIIYRLTSKSPQTVRNMPSHSGPPLSALGLLWYTF